MRSVFAVLAGYVVFALAAAVLSAMVGRGPSGPEGSTFLNAVYGMIFAAAGGYATARLVRRQRLRHVLALASIIAVVSVASLISRSSSGFPWPEWATLFLVAPSALLGGMMAARGR